MFQLVLKMYVFRCFVSMLRKYFSSAFFSKKICIYKSLIFSNLQKRIKKVLFFWSKNFGISKKVRNFASQLRQNAYRNRTLKCLAMAYIAKVRKMQDLIKRRKLCLLSLFVHFLTKKNYGKRKIFYRTQLRRR